MESRLVRIPRQLLHVELDDLAGLGVPPTAHDALRALMADLPMLPDASHSAHLVGPPEITLPCLAVLARHVGQGLRDHNLSLAHTRSTLHAERRKLVFLEGHALADILAAGNQRPLTEAVLFVHGTTPALVERLATRGSTNLATFVTSPTTHPHLAHWRSVDLATPIP
jgi:hypothetical protein